MLTDSNSINHSVCSLLSARSVCNWICLTVMYCSIHLEDNLWQAVFSPCFCHCRVGTLVQWKWDVKALETNKRTFQWRSLSALIIYCSLWPLHENECLCELNILCEVGWYFRQLLECAYWLASSFRSKKQGTTHNPQSGVRYFNASRLWWFGEAWNKDTILYPLSIYKNLWPKAAGRSSTFKLDSKHIFSRNAPLISSCTAAIHILIICLPSYRIWNKTDNNKVNRPFPPKHLHHFFSAPESEVNAGITP